jgi:hypothetical protein
MVSFSTIKTFHEIIVKKSILQTCRTPITKAIKPAELKFCNVIKTDTAEFSGTMQKTAENIADEIQLSKIINNYNKTKRSAASKHGQTTEILANWNPKYGICNKDGVYENAINELKKEGGAIDMYIKRAFPSIKNEETIVNAKKVLTEYLEHNFDIYSYDRIKNILKNFSKEIKASGENTVIYVPDANKSYGIISELYKKISPKTKFVEGWSNLKDYAAKNPNLNVVILDDCLISGESAVKTYGSIINECKGIKKSGFIYLYRL